MLACDWAGTADLIADIESDIAAGKLSAEPFGWQGVATTDRSLQQCAEIYSAATFPANHRGLPPARPDNGEKIRIGYLSGDFRAQATSFLLVGVLEQHDASRFEIHAFDNGWDDGSETRKRIDAAVHRVVNIRGLGDAQAARAIRDSGIDILVNLNGYFGDDRNHVFAQRPAPVQVNYLGFPGTLGAPYMDYIVADPIVIPDAQRTFFTEKVVHLPHSYQAKDNRRAMSNRVFSRSDFGLPQDGFVFAASTTTTRSRRTPSTDGCGFWRTFPAACWLIEDNALASNNLRREGPRAASIRRGWCSQRAWSRTNIWRGTCCADLFLDTLPYNAHTTASDAVGRTSAAHMRGRHCGPRPQAC